jgi:hypothetical protein
MRTQLFARKRAIPLEQNDQRPFGLRHTIWGAPCTYGTGLDLSQLNPRRLTGWRDFN